MPETGEQAKETRGGREQTLNAFNRAWELFQNTPDEELPPLLQAQKAELRTAKEQTLDRGKNYLVRGFQDREGNTYRQREYVPVDGLINFLSLRIDSGNLSEEEIKDHQELRSTLVENSRDYFRLPKRLDPARHTARVQDEFRRIQADPRLASGDANQDLALASSSLLEKRELILPPSPKQIPAVQPSPEPEVTPQPEPEPAPATPDEVRRDYQATIRVISQQEDLEKKAREIANKALTHELRTGNILKRIWVRSLGGEEYYRRVYIERAREALRTNGAFLPELDLIKQIVADYNRERTSAAGAVVERFKEGGLIATEKHVEVGEELKKVFVTEVLKPIVSGQITSEEQIQQKLREFVAAHQNDQQVQEIFGKDVDQFGRVTELFATDLFQVGEILKNDLAAHKFALEQLDGVVNVQFGYARWERQTEANFNNLDKFIAWAQRKKLAGAVLNPASIGALTSIAASLVLPARMTVAGLLPGVGGGLTGAIFAALRRSKDLKVDRAMHAFETAGGEKIPTGAKRREALQQFEYDRASVEELVEGGGTELLTGLSRKSVEGLTGLDLSDGQTANREEVLRRMAEIQSRLDFSVSQKVDLLAFSSRTKIEHGRLELVRAKAELGLSLQNAGMEESELARKLTELSGEWTKRFIQNKEQQDRAFRTFRLRNALGAGARGGAVGLAAGLGIQELVAVGARAAGAEVAPTVLESLAQRLTGAPTPPGGEVSAELFRDLYNGGTADLGNIDLAVDPATHTVRLIDEAAGKTITGIPEITLEPDGALTVHGDLADVPANVQEAFTDNGFVIEAGPTTTSTEINEILSPSGVHADTTTGYETTIPDGTEWARDSQGNWDLVVQEDNSVVLVDNAQFDQAGKLTGGETLHSAINIDSSEIQALTGEQAVERWKELGTQIDHREWYGYDQAGSQGNELRLYTLKEGDSLTLDMSRMAEAHQQGLEPNPIDVQEVIKNHESGFAFSLPEHTKEPIWVPDGADGKWDGLLHLDPNDTTHFVETPDGKITLGEFSQMVLNQEEFSQLSDGDIATEVYGRREVFNLGLDGKEGFIEAGRLLTEGENPVLQAFATIKGAAEAQIPGGVTNEITLTDKVTEEVEKVFHTWKLVPPEAGPGPEEVPVIPIPFAPRHPLEEMEKEETVLPSGEYGEYGEYGEILPEYIEYAEPGEYPERSDYSEYAEGAADGKLQPITLPTVSTAGQREQQERLTTPENLVEQRINAQENYMNTLRNKYKLDNPDPVAQVMLYRLNGRAKGYLDELEEVNRSLPPMSEKARLTVVIPAFNEEGKIEKTLRSWLNQQEKDGTQADREALEIVILVNRPNSTRQFDRTAQVVQQLKQDPAFAGLNIHAVQKTFNFQNQPTTITGPNGQQITVPPGSMMGMIYKYGADLATLRNLQRTDRLRKANHLIRTGGADVHSRNPDFLARVFTWFDTKPELEQYVSRSDYPPAIYEKLPLLHYSQRLNEIMNLQLTRKQSHIGLGTYRAGIYAEAGGFNVAIDLREEMNLSSRIREVIKQREIERGVVAREREVIINALDDPRRAVATILSGRPVTQMYAEWVKDEIRKIDMQKVLQQPVPEQAQLTRENVQKQTEEIFRFYFRQILESPAPPLPREMLVRRAYELAEKHLKRALFVLGVENYEIGSKVDLAQVSKRGSREIAKNLHVRINNIDRLSQLVREYPTRTRPEWMVEKARAVRGPRPVPRRETLRAPTPIAPAPAPTPQPPQEAERMAAAIPTEKVDLVENLNRRLKEHETVTSISLPISMDLLRENIISLLGKQGLRADSLTLNPEAGNFAVLGTVSGMGGSTEFNAVLTTTPDKKLQVVSKNINTMGTHQLARGRIEKDLGSLDKTLADLLSEGIDKPWEVAGFDIVANNPVVIFKKGGEKPQGPEPFERLNQELGTNIQAGRLRDEAYGKQTIFQLAKRLNEELSLEVTDKLLDLNIAYRESDQRRHNSEHRMEVVTTLLEHLEQLTQNRANKEKVVNFIGDLRRRGIKLHVDYASATGLPARAIESKQGLVLLHFYHGPERLLMEIDTFKIEPRHLPGKVA